MDQERKKVVRPCIKAVETNKRLPKISILQVFKILVSSWNAVSKETIVNCNKKSNISQSSQQAAVNNDDDPFKSLQEDLEKLHELDNAMLFNQIYQLNHLLIWIVKLTHLLLSLMMMISSPKLLKVKMKRAKMIKTVMKVRH